MNRLAAWLLAAVTRCEPRHDHAASDSHTTHTDRPWPKPDPYEAARLAAYGRNTGDRASRYWAELDINQIDRAMAEIEAHWTKEH